MMIKLGKGLDGIVEEYITWVPIICTVWWLLHNYNVFKSL